MRADGISGGTSRLVRDRRAGGISGGTSRFVRDMRADGIGMSWLAQDMRADAAAFCDDEALLPGAA